MGSHAIWPQECSTNYQWHGTILKVFHQGFYFHYGSHYEVIVEDRSFQMDGIMLISLGRNQTTCYMDAPIFISPHWDIEFHVHTYISNLAIEVMLVQNLTKKCDQAIPNASQLFNNIERNYTTIKREGLAMVYALHKFHHYLLGNKFIFYVDHMDLLYLVQKPQVPRKITRWLLLFFGI